MIEIATKYLEAVTGAVPYTGNADRVCRGCVIDSRAVERDSIFVAFAGEKVNGNDFAPQAVRAGAACVVLTEEPSRSLIKLADEHECAVFRTDDSEVFLQRLAQGYRARMGCTVVGITGSVGKTTTKEILRDLLATTYRVHATEGNFNSLIGLPLTILAAPADTQVLVLEMGMDGPGQIETLSSIAQPTYGIITKIGTSHIGLLGSRENIARAKAEIVAGMPPSSENFEGHHARLFLNGEDDFTPFIIENFARPAGVECVLCGMSADDDVSGRNVELDAESRAHFDLELQDASQIKVELGITGAQAVPDALLACACARELGVPTSVIAETLPKLRSAHMRQEQRVTPAGTRVIDDSYNASPDSTAAALDLLCSLPCEGDRIAVLGEIGELGDESPRLHGLVGAYAAAKKLGLLVCVGGEGAQCMADSARVMGMPDDRVRVVPTAEKALARLKPALGARDVVLVKGSRFVGLDRFVEGVCASC